MLDKSNLDFDHMNAACPRIKLQWLENALDPHSANRKVRIGARGQEKVEGAARGEAEQTQQARERLEQNLILKQQIADIERVAIRRIDGRPSYMRQRRLDAHTELSRMQRTTLMRAVSAQAFTKEEANDFLLSQLRERTSGLLERVRGTQQEHEMKLVVESLSRERASMSREYKHSQHIREARLRRLELDSSHPSPSLDHERRQRSSSPEQPQNDASRGNKPSAEQDHCQPHRRANTQFDSRANLELSKASGPLTARPIIIEAQRLPLLPLDDVNILHSNREQPHIEHAERLLNQQDDVKELANLGIDQEEALPVEALKTKELIDRQNQGAIRLSTAWTRDSRSKQTISVKHQKQQKQKISTPMTEMRARPRTGLAPGHRQSLEGPRNIKARWIGGQARPETSHPRVKSNFVVFRQHGHERNNPASARTTQQVSVAPSPALHLPGRRQQQCKSNTSRGTSVDQTRFINLKSKLLKTERSSPQNLLKNAKESRPILGSSSGLLKMSPHLGHSKAPRAPIMKHCPHKSAVTFDIPLTMYRIPILQQRKDQIDKQSKIKKKAKKLVDLHKTLVNQSKEVFEN